MWRFCGGHRRQPRKTFISDWLLHRVFECSQSLLRLDKGRRPQQFDGVKLRLRLQNFDVIGRARLKQPLRGLRSLLLARQEGVCGFEFGQGVAIARERCIQFAAGARLDCHERGSGFPAPRLGVSNRPMILVQDREWERAAQRIIIDALIPCVARSEMKIGILFGDFELEPSLTCFVFRQRAKNVRTMKKRFSPKRNVILRRRKLIEGCKRQANASKGVFRQADGRCQTNPRLGAQFFRVSQLQRRLRRSQPRELQVGKRNLPGLEAVFQ